MKLITLFLTCFTTLTAFCQANWSLSNTGIPSGYSPNDFAKAINGDIYLVASQYSGSSFKPKLLKSTNNGSSWSEIIMSGLTNVQNTNTIIFSGNKILLGGSNSTTASYYVYVSDDNGSNWTLSNSGIPSGYSPNDFAIATNGDVYLASAYYNGTSFEPKLLKSTNNGSSWNEVTMSGLSNIQLPNSIIFNGSKLLLSGTGSGSYYVYSSTNNGLNWTLSNSGVPSGYSVNDFTNATGQIIYAACSQFNGTSFVPHIIKSTNGGTNWSDITGLSGLTSLQNTNSIVYGNNNLLLGGSNSSTSSYFVFSSTVPTTSLEDESSNIPFSIFPNPFNETLFLYSQLGNDLQIRLTNSFGQTLFEKKITAEKELINTSSLLAGVYFVTVYDQEKRKTFKLVKN